MYDNDGDEDGDEGEKEEKKGEEDGKEGEKEKEEQKPEHEQRDVSPVSQRSETRQPREQRSAAGNRTEECEMETPRRQSWIY